MIEAVMISIRPKWCDLIASGKKTIEVRKTRPKLETPFKCYIYCTKNKNSLPNAAEMYIHGSGKVIGEFICDKIITVDCDSVEPFDRETEEYIGKETCLTAEQIRIYGHCRCVKGWHISDLKIYDKPKNLSDFLKYSFEDEHALWEDLHSIGVRGIPIVQFPKEPEIEDYQVKRPPQSWFYVEEMG